MTVYCSECGAPIEEGMDFCTACGALRRNAFDVDESGRLRPVDENAIRVCPGCGYGYPYSMSSCPECGRQADVMQVRRQPKKLDSRDITALIVGLVIGAMGICGAGHLVIGRYSRGIMYIVLSGIFLYVLVASGYYMGGSGPGGLFTIRLFSLLIFFHSAMDLFQSVYYPPEPPSDQDGGKE